MRVKEIHLRVVLFTASALSMLWGFRLLLTDHAPVVFDSGVEDMSYGWYVPLFSIYVLWRERRELTASVGTPSAWGILLSLPFFFSGILGADGYQVRLEIVGFVGILVSLTLAFFGTRTTRQALFPLLFLLFCLPLHSFLDIVTIHLRLFAVSVAYGTLRGLGMDIVREGTMLFSTSGAFSVDVAEPCSGLRSLFAMMALTAGYSYFTQPTWLRRGILFALSVPIAIAGNVVRILSIAIVGTTCSPEFATGFYHDYSGYVVFLVAVSLMVCTGGLVTRIGDRLSPPAKPFDVDKDEASASEPVARSAALAGPGVLRLAVPAVMAALTIGLMVYQGKALNPVLCEAPSRRLGEIAGFTSEVQSPSEGELNVLPPDTIIDKRLYTAADGNWYLVSLIIGGRSKSSIHRPEMCLPTQGFQMTSPRNLDAGGIDWRCVTIQKQLSSLGFAYTFYNQDGFRTSSHLHRIFRDVWDRSMRHRIDRWAMVTVNASTSNDRQLASFLANLKGLFE